MNELNLQFLERFFKFLTGMRWRKFDEWSYSLFIKHEMFKGKPFFSLKKMILNFYLTWNGSDRTEESVRCCLWFCDFLVVFGHLDLQDDKSAVLTRTLNWRYHWKWITRVHDQYWAVCFAKTWEQEGKARAWSSLRSLPFQVKFKVNNQFFERKTVLPLNILCLMNSG